MKALADFYRGRRVFVTGHTGFKGAWLAFWLSQMGAEVHGYALEPEPGSPLFDALRLRERVRHAVGDVRDYPRLCDAMREARPEIVFHLAAQPLVRRSYADPKYTFDVNVGGGINLLEATRAQVDHGLRALVFVTSDKCYDNREWVWGYRENDRLGGADPYSASKAAAELVAHAYARSFFDSAAAFGMATVRAGNVIGGGDMAPDRIVPDCIRSLRAGRPIELRNEDAVRPWQHVLEPLHGYMRLGMVLGEQPRKFSGPWNFGPDVASIQSVRALAERVSFHWGGGATQSAETRGPHEATLLHLCSDKARQGLGWRPAWGFERTIEETVAWYRQESRGVDVTEITRLQIAKFVAEASAT